MIRAIILLSQVSLVAATAQAALIHDYRLDGSYADELGGPSLVPNGGTLGGSSYAFGAGQGLTLSNWLAGAATAGNYSIEMVFEFDNLSSYRRILDFKDRTSDTGLYNQSSTLNFYNVVSSAPGVFAVDTNARVVLTRDGGTNQVVGYVNGVQQISFIDGTSLGTFSGLNNIINFLQDNTSGGSSGENGTGTVSLIRIYDAPLSASEVEALTDPETSEVPEPSSLALLGLGALFGARRVLRRSKSAASV